jgi:hypothetical protein
MELSFLLFRGAFRFLQKRFVICDDIVLADIFIIDPLSSKISKSGHANEIYVDENNTLIERMTCDQNIFSIRQPWYMVVIKLYIQIHPCMNSSLMRDSGNFLQYETILRMAFADHLPVFFIASSVNHLPSFSLSFDSMRSLIRAHFVVNSACRVKKAHRWGWQLGVMEDSHF